MGFSLQELAAKSGFRLPQLFKSRSGIVGVDMGSANIKVVQLRKEKEKAVLETYGELATGPYINLNVGQSARLPDDKVVEAPKDILKEANIKSNRAVVTIPLKSSFITIIEIPTVGGKDITEIIAMESRRYIPVPISEVEMDWWVLPERFDETADSEYRKKFSKVLLVAIHKDVIAAHKKVIAGAGMEISAIEVETFSVIRSALGRESLPVAVVDVGASSIKVAVVDFGVIMSSHSIARGSQDLTVALSRSLGVDFSRAEEMKREVGLSDLPEHREVVSVIEPILEHAFSEISRAIKDYQRKYKRSVGKTVLTGGGALLNGLVDFAVKRLSLEVNLADPFSRTEHPAFLEEILQVNGPIFSTSLGSALRDL